MKTLIAGAALGALLLGAVPTPAQAEATVDGNADYHVVQIPNGNDARIFWSCQAVASERVAGTSVTCTLFVGGEFVAEVANATEGMATATANVTPHEVGAVQVCWEATALRLDGTLATDSGCNP